VPVVVEDEFDDIAEAFRSSTNKNMNRDSYIMKEQSNARMKLNETIDLSDISLSKVNSESVRGGSPQMKAKT
jgi:hypothetical protein